MGTIYYPPNGVGNNTFSSGTYTDIDDGTAPAGDPGTDDCISAEAQAGIQLKFPAHALGSISDIAVHISGRGTYGVYLDINISVDGGSGWEGVKSAELVEAPAYNWQHTANWNFSPAIASLGNNVLWVNIDTDGDPAEIFECSVEVTYSDASGSGSGSSSGSGSGSGSSSGTGTGTGTGAGEDTAVHVAHLIHHPIFPRH